MELWDLYDSERHHLDCTIERGAAHPAGTYHIVVNIWVVNDKGNLLLTLRSSEKKQYPNLWENQGGSVLAGEESLSAAQRELSEEIGIEVHFQDFVYLGSSLEKTAIVDVYAVRRNIDLRDIHLQAGETVDVKWITLPELEHMEAEGCVSDATVRRKKAVFPAWESFIRSK